MNLILAVPNGRYEGKWSIRNAEGYQSIGALKENTTNNYEYFIYENAPVEINDRFIIEPEDFPSNLLLAVNKQNFDLYF